MHRSRLRQFLLITQSSEALQRQRHGDTEKMRPHTFTVYIRIVSTKANYRRCSTLLVF